jgi:hypothetical protein
MQLYCVQPGRGWRFRNGNTLPETFVAENARTDDAEMEIRDAE